MKITVRFFALYRERVGKARIGLVLDSDATVKDALGQLRLMFPNLAPPNVDIVVAVNAIYALPKSVLYNGDEVALIPPVSGGAL